jgi:hypothetical protein
MVLESNGYNIERQETQEPVPPHLINNCYGVTVTVKVLQ